MGMVFLLLVVIAFGIAISISVDIDEKNRKTEKDNIESITLGMSEEDMLNIMGGSYNKSLLKNNRVKYEWRFSNGRSYGHSYKGFSTRTYTGVRKVDIYCKDGVVEEVKPYNM